MDCWPALSCAAPQQIRLAPRCQLNADSVFFACFRFLIFHAFSREGQPTPLAPMCGRPWIDLFKKIESGRFGGYGVVNEHDIRLLLTH